MSYLSSDYVQCETIQNMLDDQFATCSVLSLDPMPALEAILSTQLANGISQSVSDGSGKVKTVKVVYERRLLETDVTSSSGTRACSTSLESFDSYQTYEIDPTVWLRAAEKFEVANLATVCTTDVQQMIAKKIGKVVDVLERKIATQTASQLAGMVGNWSSNVTANASDELELATLVSTATKQLDPFMWGNLDLALQETGYCQAPIIVGGSDFYKAARVYEAGCCSTTGADIGAITSQYGKAVMYDKRVQAALGNAANKSIVFQPGSVALIYYNEASQVPNLGANYAKFRVNAPRTGIPIDIVMQDNCGVISVLGFANTKLVGLPTDMFSNTDEYQGVTYVNKIKVVNPA
jgi:hypothetical protein